MPALFDRFCERRHAESPEQQRVFLDGGQFEMLGEPPHIDIALATASAEAVGSELGYLETVCSEPPQDAGALTFRRAAETRLALAMLTHHRLGEHSCVTAIADLVELVGRRVVGSLCIVRIVQPVWTSRNLRSLGTSQVTIMCGRTSRFAEDTKCFAGGIQRGSNSSAGAGRSLVYVARKASILCACRSSSVISPHLSCYTTRNLCHSSRSRARA